MLKFTKIFLLLTAILVIVLVCYFFVGTAPVPEKITWGVDFSQMHAESLGLNWKELYSSIVGDLGAKNIKLHTQWDWVEGKKEEYYFKDIDWQIKTAEERDAKIIYVVGMKTGRWPECHIPEWAQDLSREEQQAEILKYIEVVVNRYKESEAVLYWQVENEPLFYFGKCPWRDKDFLEKEIELVKKLDPSREIIVSDSGEQSLWFGVAKRGDIVGITMYRKVWSKVTNKFGFYSNIFLPPVHYWRKAQLIDRFFGKKVLCIELQAEPWTPKLLYDAQLKEQEKTMNLEIFKKNIEYAKKTGLDTFYFWGVEWWYQMKEKHNRPEIWNEAKKVFSN
jgi:hypothetical protein